MGFFTLALMQFAKTHTALVDMVYPYISRMMQTILAGWSGSVDYCLWQLWAVLLGIVILASVVLLVIFRWNIIQWFGWVLACGSVVFFLNTGIYGLNEYAGPISDDLKLDVTGYTQEELETATKYYLDQANQLSNEVSRDEDGNVKYPDFDTINTLVAKGFENLTYQKYFPIFAGSTQPVKQLGWGGMFSSMGMNGFFCPITGEAAVNPDIPAIALPYAISNQMAKRMAISRDVDADFAAYLACRYSDSIELQYTAYFMAYNACQQAVKQASGVNPASAIAQGESENLRRDLETYHKFYSSNKNEKAVALVGKLEAQYDELSDVKEAVTVYTLADLLVCWHIQEIVVEDEPVQVSTFDPFDKNQVDLTGLIRSAG